MIINVSWFFYLIVSIVFITFNCDTIVVYNSILPDPKVFRFSHKWDCHIGFSSSRNPSIIELGLKMRKVEFLNLFYQLSKQWYIDSLFNKFPYILYPWKGRVEHFGDDLFILICNLFRNIKAYVKRLRDASVPSHILHLYHI